MTPVTARGQSALARRPLPGSEAHRRPETTAKKCVNPCARFVPGFPTDFWHKPLDALSHAGTCWPVGPVGRTDARRRAHRSTQGRGGPRPVRLPSVRGGCDFAVALSRQLPLPSLPFFALPPIVTAVTGIPPESLSATGQTPTTRLQAGPHVAPAFRLTGSKPRRYASRPRRLRSCPRRRTPESWYRRQTESRRAGRSDTGWERNIDRAPPTHHGSGP